MIYNNQLLKNIIKKENEIIFDIEIFNIQELGWNGMSQLLINYNFDDLNIKKCVLSSHMITIEDYNKENIKLRKLKLNSL